MMTELSITRAWSEATDFMKEAFGPLFLIAFLLIALPGAAIDYVLPAPDAPLPATRDQWLAMFGPALSFIPVLVVLATVGAIAINHLAIRAGATVGEALMVGARRFIIVLLAGLLVGVAAGLTLLPLMLLLPAQGGALGSIGLGLMLVPLVYLAFFLALSVKLLLMTAVAAAERGGPIALIARSWTLTRGHFWKLLGFLVLFWIAAAVLIVVVSLVAGLILALLLGLPERGTSAYFALNLASAALQALATTAFAVAVARIYAQLAGSGDRDVFA